ncbi:MAG: molecular chaperone TorD family protein [Anaerolineae bacterium]
MNPVARATAYAALAAIFRGVQPDGSVPSGELLAALEALDEGLAHIWQQAMMLGQGARGRPGNGSAESATPLRRTFNRLFVGPLPPLAHPYESVYRTPNGRLMGEVTMQVIQAYAEAGLAVTEDRRDPPDHVAVELEFMAHLIEEEVEARAEGDQVRAAAYLTRQINFLHDHLAQWIPHFCNRVAQANPEGFYGQAAVTLAGFIVRDLEWTTAAKQAPPAPATGPSPSGEGRLGEWEVVFHPTRNIPCTLCGICAEVCRPGALQLDQREWEVELTFDPAGCDGCGYCKEYCPERILVIEHTGADAGPKQARQMAVSAMAPCARCGRPLTPQAMLDRILQRFRRRKGDPADEAAMYLCHRCKLGAVTGN